MSRIFLEAMAIDFKDSNLIKKAPERGFFLGVAIHAVEVLEGHFQSLDEAFFAFA